MRGAERSRDSDYPTCWETRHKLLTDPDTGHTLQGKHRSRHWMGGTGHTMREILDTPCEALDSRHWMRGTGCESPPHMLGNQMRATTHRSTRWTHPARKHRSRYWMRGPEHTMQGIPDPDTGHTMRGTGCESPPHMLGSQMRATRRPTHWTHPARELQIEALDARQWTRHARDPRSRHWTHHARHWMPGTGCQSPRMLSIPHSSIRVSHAMHRLFFFRLHASKQQSESDVVSRMEVMECYVVVAMEY